MMNTLISFDAMEKASLNPKQGIFFNGQVFDAFVFISKLIKTAEKCDIKGINSFPLRLPPGMYFIQQCEKGPAESVKVIVH